MLEALPPVSDEFKSRYGIKNFLKEYPDDTALRVASIFEPTCTICGLTSGYQGPGSKTVLPAKASAKVDFRLVPNQTPTEVLEQLRTHLDREGFQDIEIEFLGGGPPARTDPDDDFVKLVVETATEAFGSQMATGAHGRRLRSKSRLCYNAKFTGCHYRNRVSRWKRPCAR